MIPFSLTNVKILTHERSYINKLLIPKNHATNLTISTPKLYKISSVLPKYTANCLNPKPNRTNFT